MQVSKKKIPNSLPNGHPPEEEKIQTLRETIRNIKII